MPEANGRRRRRAPGRASPNARIHSNPTLRQPAPPEAPPLSDFDRLAAAFADRYRLERELGAGGMATVYLAHDPRHARPVAIKVLRPELAAVLGAERFLLEIRTTAALQHPHILPLFDSGEADGFLYYVMPFVDGETLRARLDRETQIDVAEAVRITTDIADALQYAHDHGIVHRDIKPENILLANGRPMVADFGIALAVSAAAGGRLTETGLSLGTPHYMSPEQATADRTITGRSDIYSLASVCYEMLAGHPPHTGASAQQVIMKIIAEPVVPVTAYRRTVPPHVAAAVARALEKLPADRFAQARDFAAALADRGFTTAMPGARGRAAAPVGGRQRAALLAGWAVAAAALVVAAWALRRPVPSAQVLRYSMALPAAQRMGPSRGTRLALSDDGTALAYVGTDGRGLWLRRRDQLEATPLPGTENASNPVFAPDGSRLAFSTSGTVRAIRVVGLRGAPPVTIVDSGVGADGLAWGSDGFLYYDGLTSGGTVGLMRVSPDGGLPTRVTTVDTVAGEMDHIWPQPLPAGRGILFTLVLRGARAETRAAVLDLATGRHRVLVEALTARYAPSGHLVYLTDGGELLAAPFDLEALELTGPPSVIASGIGSREFGATDFALSASGTLMYLPGALIRREAIVTTVGRDGTAVPIDSTWSAQFFSVALAPDGRRLAVGVLEAEGGSVWVRDLATGSLTRMSFGGTQAGRPIWSPDGRTLGFISNRNGRREFWSGPADGSAPATLHASLPEGQLDEVSWSADGQWLLLVPSGDAGVVHARRTRGDTALRPLQLSRVEVRGVALSPDGRFVSYTSAESGRSEVYVRPFPDVGSARWTVSTRGGWDARWSRAGRELLFFTGSDELESVEIVPGATLTTGRRQVLFRGAVYRAGTNSWDITPDDARFVLIRTVSDTSSPGEIVVVEQFTRELGRKVTP